MRPISRGPADILSTARGASGNPDHPQTVSARGLSLWVQVASESQNSASEGASTRPAISMRICAPTLRVTRGAGELLCHRPHQGHRPCFGTRDPTLCPACSPWAPRAQTLSASKASCGERSTTLPGRAVRKMLGQWQVHGSDEHPKQAGV